MLHKSCSNYCFLTVVALKDLLLNALATCAYSLQRAIEIMDSAGLVLSNDDAREAKQSLISYVQSFCWLALHCCDNHLLLFKVRPKTHYLYHVATEVGELRLNQNLTHTFEEESFLGKIKAIAAKTHGKTMTQRVFQRYLLCFAVFIDQDRRRT